MSTIRLHLPRSPLGRCLMRRSAETTSCLMQFSIKCCSRCITYLQSVPGCGKGFLQAPSVFCFLQAPSAFRYFRRVQTLRTLAQSSAGLPAGAGHVLRPAVPAMALCNSAVAAGVAES